MPSLLSQKSALASPEAQIKLLENSGFSLPSFDSKLKEIDLFPLKPTKIDIFQVNLGKMCNQTCRHCHVDAGPDRKEIMTKNTMKSCLKNIHQHSFSTVDLTGGAPEMHPHFRWFVEEIKTNNPNTRIIVRCNLTIILSNPKYYDLPHFFKTNNIEIVCSFPHYSKSYTDRQRGNGVFEKSIEALKLLNQVGYGRKNSHLKLNLVYNPVGAFLPSDQLALERDFKEKLSSDFDIEFNELYCITNMPISRYLEYLINSGNYETYMSTLVKAFNSSAAKNVMCRNTLSVAWDGYLYHCDFNQMLDLKTHPQSSQHIDQFNRKTFEGYPIVVGQHCFGCTAGSGSSCGGATS